MDDDGRQAADGGREPDYRMSLAAERTYLAHIRTGLAMVAGGVAVVAAFPDDDARPLRLVLGVAVIVAGAVVLAVARPRWKAVQRAMRLGAPMPQSPMLELLGWLLAAAAVVTAIAVLLL